MLVFIDESGDAGFRLDRGSSPIFVAGMVIFLNKDDAIETQSAIDRLVKDTGFKGEFKFSKHNDRIKGLFFDAVKSCPFNVRAIVVKKGLIQSPRLRTNQDKFYDFFVRQMISQDDGALSNAKVVIDGRGERKIKQDLQRYLKQNCEAISSISIKDSKKDRLLQLADMCIGAIARAERDDRKNADRWFTTLNRAGRIGKVWTFQ